MAAPHLRKFEPAGIPEVVEEDGVVYRQEGTTLVVEGNKVASVAAKVV
jgi:hypothetical protein